MRRPVGAWAARVEHRTDRSREVDVAGLTASAEEVGVAGATATRRRDQPLDMVVHVKPVASVEARAVDRDRRAFEGVPDHRRDELFGMLAGAVCFWAIGAHNPPAPFLPPPPPQKISPPP